MHCLFITLKNGRTFANLSELLRALLSARCKYRLNSRNSVFVIIAETTRLWQSSRLSQYISCLGCPTYSLTKRIVRKALSFSTVMVTFQTGIISWLDAYSFHFSICQEKFFFSYNNNVQCTLTFDVIKIKRQKKKTIQTQLLIVSS